MKSKSQRVANSTYYWRMEKKLTLSAFAAALVEKLVGRSLTRQAVSLWELGKQCPALDLLLGVAMVYSDWRQQWALECLKAVAPESAELAVSALAQKGWRVDIYAD